MADSAITKWIARPGVSFATRYGLALASVTGALLLELLFAFLHQCMYLKIAISALVSMLLCQSLSAQSREHMEKPLYEVNS